MERINGILSMYLRHYVATDYKDWIKWLPIAEFNYNTTQNKTLDNTPFQVTHRFDVLKSIDLIGIKQSDELTLGFYLVGGAQWMARKEAIMNTAKVRLKVA